jgi:hypothetical protein
MIVRFYRVLFWGCERQQESIVLDGLSDLGKTTTFKGVVEIDVTLMFIQFYRVLFWGCERLPESIGLEHLCYLGKHRWNNHVQKGL